MTEMLHMLFSTIDFPYRSIDLGRSYDWNLMQELKERSCTLDEVNASIFRICVSTTVLKPALPSDESRPKLV